MSGVRLRELQYKRQVPTSDWHDDQIVWLAHLVLRPHLRPGTVWSVIVSQRKRQVLKFTRLGDGIRRLRARIYERPNKPFGLGRFWRTLNDDSLIGIGGFNVIASSGDQRQGWPVAQRASRKEGGPASPKFEGLVPGSEKVRP
jgi:hypothetical protein